jgi:acyl-CoA thioesterase
MADTPADPQGLAEAVGQALMAEDHAARHAGIRLDAIGPGSARMSMLVRADMVNAHGICHGGLIFTLADTAFAYACNARNARTVAQSCSIEFLAMVREGDRLEAVCREQASVGRSSVYDVTVTDERARTIALFRGRGRTLGDALVGI